MISFCVTYYNQESFVRQSLLSILTMKLPCEVEILIGDDGSSDNTISEINKIQQQFHYITIKLFTISRNCEGGGQDNPIHRASSNRLNLAKEAKGDYIIFLDGDDYYCRDDFLDEAITALKKNKELIGYAFNFCFSYPNRSKIGNQHLLEQELKSRDYIMHYYTPAEAIVFKNILTNTDIKILETSKNFDDNLITIYMLQFGNLYYNPKVVCAYTQNEKSIYNSLNDFEKIILNAEDYDNLTKVAPKFKNEIFIRQFPYIKTIFKVRGKINKLLSYEQYNNIYKKNKALNNTFILSLLDWNKINIFKKYKIYYWYFTHKLIRKLILVRRKFKSVNLEI